VARRELSDAQLSVVQAVRAVLPADATHIVDVRVACSGGADSLALAAGLRWLDVHEPDPLRRSSALVVDHGLQAGSGAVADGVVEVLGGLGLTASSVHADVRQDDPDGLEAAARKARYEALTSGDADIVLLGHTMDDQAETVLLGLVRGSGTRSLAGMPSHWRLPEPATGGVPSASGCPGSDSGHRDAVDGRRGVVLCRPLLGLRRMTTRQACADWSLGPWDDPMNDDARFTRVRVRRLLPAIEDALGPGVVEALSRTASLARADADRLDAEATALLATSLHPSGDLKVAPLLDAPDALRGRIVRQWLAGGGVTELSFERTQAVLTLVAEWHGQDGVHLPGGRRVARAGDVLRMSDGRPSG